MREASGSRGAPPASEAWSISITRITRASSATENQSRPRKRWDPKIDYRFRKAGSTSHRSTRKTGQRTSRTSQRNPWVPATRISQDTTPSSKKAINAIKPTPKRNQSRASAVRRTDLGIINLLANFPSDRWKRHWSTTSLARWPLSSQATARRWGFRISCNTRMPTRLSRKKPRNLCPRDDRSKPSQAPGNLIQIGQFSRRCHQLMHSARGGRAVSKSWRSSIRNYWSPLSLNEWRTISKFAVFLSKDKQSMHRMLKIVRASGLAPTESNPSLNQRIRTCNLRSSQCRV